jgi:hypothetical protein
LAAVFAVALRIGGFMAESVEASAFVGVEALPGPDEVLDVVEVSACFPDRVDDLVEQLR